jgi:hypothetical protein
MRPWAKTPTLATRCNDGLTEANIILHFLYYRTLGNGCLGGTRGARSGSAPGEHPAGSRPATRLELRENEVAGDLRHAHRAHRHRHVDADAVQLVSLDAVRVSRDSASGGRRGQPRSRGRIRSGLGRVLDGRDLADTGRDGRRARGGLDRRTGLHLLSVRSLEVGAGLADAEARRRKRQLEIDRDGSRRMIRLVRAELSRMHVFESCHDPTTAPPQGCTCPQEPPPVDDAVSPPPSSDSAVPPPPPHDSALVTTSIDNVHRFVFMSAIYWRLGDGSKRCGVRRANLERFRSGTGLARPRRSPAELEERRLGDHGGCSTAE